MADVTRREFLLTSGATALALSMGTPGAPEQGLRVEHHDFAIAGLDPRHDGLRLVQLSDIHVGARTPRGRIRAAVAAANACAPDLVVLTGDFLSRDRAGVGLMREQLGGLSSPAVAVLGNHDHWVDPAGARRALEGHGYSVLRNQHTVLRLRGAPFTVVGIDDFMTRHAEPARALAGAPGGSRVVLAHGPRTADLLRGLRQPMLVMSGHTHGGQVNLPGLTPYLLRTILHEPYLRGRYDLDQVQLYVNRGVGNSGIGIRINADPEITVATLRLPEASSGAVAPAGRSAP